MFARRYLLPPLVFVFYTVLKWTWRISIAEAPSFRARLNERKPIVIGHWHGDELGLLHLLRPYHVACMTSKSRDGELMTRVIHLLGGRTSRGSSSRDGAQALRGILRLSREGWNPSVAVDGPRGPLHEVKPGIFEISRMTKAPICPLSVSADRVFIFEKSWNKAILPKPFARVQVVWGDLIDAVPREADSKDPSWAKVLKTQLDNVKQQAEKLLRGAKDG